MRWLPALSLLPLALLPACSSGPSAEELAEQEKAEMAAALGVAVARIDEVDLGLKTRVRDNIAGHAALQKRHLWSLQLDEVELRAPAGQLVRARVLRIPLHEPFAGGTAFYAFDREGRLYALGLSGEAFERGAHGQWPGFLAQFKGRRAASTAELPTPVAAFRITEAAEADPTGEVATLYAHHRLMAENVARTTQVLTLTGRGEIPSSDLLRDWAARYAGLRGMASQLEPILGRATAAGYDRHVVAGQEILAQAAFAASAGQAGEVRRLVGGELQRSSCQACQSRRRAWRTPWSGPHAAPRWLAEAC